MPFGIIGWMGPGMMVVGFGDRSMGRGTFGVEFSARHRNPVENCPFWQWYYRTALPPTLRRRCATVPQPSELQFGVVRAVGRGIAV